VYRKIEHNNQQFLSSQQQTHATTSQEQRCSHQHHNHSHQAYNLQIPTLSASLLTRLDNFRTETDKIKHNAQSFNQK
jgi:hypothetical protein